MSKLRKKMKMDLELRGYSAKTVSSYLMHVKLFALYFNQSPDLLDEEHIREYLHYIISEKKVCTSYVNGAYSAIRFLNEITLHRSWDMQNIPRVKNRKKMPLVLSISEVKQIFSATSNLKHKAIFMTAYGAGLRVSEVANLKISDIDSKNMQILIQQGKGNKDRYSILSQTNLEILRIYYKKYRPSHFLFPNDSTQQPLAHRSIQRCFYEARERSGIIKPVSFHTLRHSFATHLLSAGVSIAYIQRLLGHSNIHTTSIYLHVANKDLKPISSPLDLMGGDFLA